MSSATVVVRWLAVGALFAGACVPAAETEEQKVFDEDTVMGQIQSDGEMTVGIEADLAPYSSVDPTTGEAKGFVVDLATAVADELGVEATYVGGTGAELISKVETEEVDIAFPAVTITEELLRESSFTDPVYVAHQKILVPSDAGISDVQELDSRRACSFIDADTQVPVEQINEDVKIIEATPGECRKLIDRGKVDAVIGSDVHLMSIAARQQGLEIVGDELTTEGYGAVTPARGMTDLVNSTMADAKSDGRWLSIFERWLAPVAGVPDTEPPDLTVEEAAALYPSDL